MAHPLRIQRKRTKGYRLPPDAVVVTRPTIFGNPFTGEKAVDAYREYLKGGSAHFHLGDGLGMAFIPAWDHALKVKQLLPSLRGKKLACFCGLDKSCHADVLCELANS